MLEYAIPSWVSNYLGFEFEDNGRGPVVFDCWGLMAHVLRTEFGCAVSDLSGAYESTKDVRIAALVEEQKMCGTWLEVTTPRTGDVILLRAGRVAMHVGVVVALNRMLTTERGTRSCVERYNSLQWKGRVVGFYRFNGDRLDG